jgi:hypothetical protein
VIISRIISPSSRKSAEGKQRLVQVCIWLRQLQGLRPDGSIGKSAEAEFLMRLEVELMMNTSEDDLDKVMPTLAKVFISPK